MVGYPNIRLEPRSSSETQTHLDLWHSTLGYNKFTIEILKRFQSEVLRLIVVAPWYVSNSVIRKDLQIPTVKEEISRFKLALRCSPPYTHK
jgi:hypothetical protein